VIEASRAVQVGVGAVDQAVADIFSELNQDLWLVTKDHHYLEEQWLAIDAQCSRRSQEIRAYGERLEAIEGSRAAIIAGELRRLVEALAAIAFKPLTDIERLVEQEAFELNTVLIMNRQSHVELLALMEKQHILVAMEARLNWEARQRAWRQLRHDRGVREFQDELNSSAYTNPPSRIDLLARTARAQGDRHAVRLEKLAELRRLEFPESKALETMKKGFEALHEQEGLAIDELQQGLATIRDEREEAAIARRESLRAELHVYGAFEDEPLLEAHASAIDQVLNDPSNDTFFRSAGGLKPELKELMAQLRDPMLIYDASLQPAMRRVEVLLCGLDLPIVLEAQGKSGMKSNLVDTLERLKNATKGDVAPIMPILLAQTRELATVTALDPLLLHHLSEVLEEVTMIVSDLNLGHGGDGKSQGTSRSRSKGGGSNSSNLGGEKRSSSRAPSSIGGSKAKSNNRSSMAKSASFKGWEQPEVNMLQVRAVQKRLALLLRASDLEPTVHQELRNVRASLKQASKCNVAIDKVVAAESADLLARRCNEQEQLSNEVVAFLERCTWHVHSVSTRMVAFYVRVASVLEHHATQDETIDAASEYKLYELLEDFKEADGIKEAEVSKHSARMQLAADEGELETAYASVLTYLDQIYESYYAYHAAATAAAEEHPEAISQETQQYMSTLCESLGLGDVVPPQSEEERLEAEDAAHSRAKDKKKGQGGDSEVVAPERPETFSVEGSDVTYAVMNGPESIAQELMRPPDDDDGEDEEEPVPTAADPITASAVNEGDGDEPANEDAAEGAEGAVGEEAAAAVEGEDEGEEDEEETWVAPWWSSSSFEAKTKHQEAALKEPLLEEYLVARDSAFVPLSEDEIEAIPDLHHRDEYRRIAQHVRERREAAKREKSKAKAAERAALFAQSPPTDPNGNPAALKVAFPQPLVVDMLASLRSFLVKHSEQREAQRATFAASLRDDRCGSYTEELEERLRLHWPRKGRVEVNIRQVRESELIAHRQRAKRHCRIVREKNDSHQEQFESIIAGYAAKSKDFVGELKALEMTLVDQESLAALQGVDGKCKKMLMAFREECGEALAHLERCVTSDPTKLYALSTSLLRATNLFGDSNGDYSEFEYEELQKQLQLLNGEIEESVKGRVLQIQALMSRQEVAMSGDAQFTTALESSLQELSLREAIGMKYGAPRRNAQERLRTEQTCDANSADAVDELLNLLDRVCSEAQAALESENNATSPSKPPASSSSLLVTPPRSALTREILREVRQLLVRRATYLEFLPAPTSVAWDTEVPPEPMLTRQDELALKKAVPVYVPTLGETMALAMDGMEERCRAETKALYEAEGKEAALEPLGVPEALHEWLVKTRKGVLGDDGYRDKSRRRLRAQVERLEDITGKNSNELTGAAGAGGSKKLHAGALLVAESAARALHVSKLQKAAREKSFESRLSVWEAAKAKHRAALRPQMGRPDSAQALEALCQAEKARCSEVVEAIEEVQREVVKAQVQESVAFVGLLSEQVSSAHALLDTLVLSDDLGYLPGDELVEKKRKSLKRLKKLQRTQEAAEVGNEEGETGGEARPVPDHYEKPDGRHCPRRTWPPLPIAQLREVFEKHGVALNPSTGLATSDETAEANDAPAAGEAEDGSFSPADDWIQELEQQFSAGPSSVVTTAQRLVMRARDENWALMVAQLDRNLADLSSHFGKLHAQEQQWEGAWQKLVDALVQDNRDAEH
jgi:hypothetical protein